MEVIRRMARGFRSLAAGIGASGNPAELDGPQLLRRARYFKYKLDRIKATIKPADFAWYPYDSFSNLYPLKQILSGKTLFFQDLAAGLPVLDLGCADGDVAFFLEWLGLRVHAVDWPATNYNGMRGVRALKGALASSIEIYEMDLDNQFQLPADQYGAAFFFGTLYHLKSPFYVLETLARRAKYCLLSARVARVTPDGRVPLEGYPLAYLLDAREANNDPTNYWIFSNSGLRRLLERAGWDISDYCNTGNTCDSNPATPEGDERAFCLLQSRQGFFA